MRKVLLSLLCAASLAAGPLRVTQVVREGPPPYEESSRLYRLEGDGCQVLKAGEILTLSRAGERRSPGQLKVTAVKDGYALKGDLAAGREPLRRLPLLPALTQAFPPVAGPAQPAVPVPLLAQAAPVILEREPVFFRLGEGTLSPAGRTKLKSWVATWGQDGHWVLACPPWPGETPTLRDSRVGALRGELEHLGIAQVEVLTLPAEKPGHFPVIYVERRAASLN